MGTNGGVTNGCETSLVATSGSSCSLAPALPGMAHIEFGWATSASWRLRVHHPRRCVALSGHAGSPHHPRG